ncbi:MAG: hypothetical protein IKF29_05800 [Oceanobacillus sp.]|nr:hypothetical protein [Oceanobacillus sp.]
MKHTVRAFSVGLLTSAVILFIIFYFVEDTVKSVEEIDVEEMIEHVESEGYAVLDQQEYISYSVQKKQKAENAETEKSDSPKNDTKDKSSKETKAESKQESQDKSKKETSDESDDSNEDSDDEIKEEDNKENVEKEPENNVVQYTLTISPGMASSDISALLAEQNIIDNASEFNSYLDEHEYSLHVQIGTFEVSNDMSFYEIAERIAR